MGVWHKYDGINTMAQKGESAPNDTAPGLKKGASSKKAMPAKKPFGGKQAAPFGRGTR